MVPFRPSGGTSPPGRDEDEIPLQPLPSRAETLVGGGDGWAGAEGRAEEEEEISKSDSEGEVSDSDGVVLIRTSKMVDESLSESSWTILLQVVFPFLVAGCGMVGAGLVLDEVQHWDVFTRVPEIFILVPALLGLKGNLEMTLAARLSTLANLGRMDSWAEQRSTILANLALIQAQAAVVAFLASTFAIALAWIPKGAVDWHHAFLLSSSSLTTAALASLALGLVMAAVVLLSRRYRINPDNVATPIAASLGDLITLALLAAFGTLFLHARANLPYINPIVTGSWIALTPLWVYVAARNAHTAPVLKSGWAPVILAMLLSSGGGFILKFAVERFHGIAVFQPVINGIGGNLVAVQASRISTSLHRTGKPGPISAHTAASIGIPQSGLCATPLQSFLGSTPVARAARVLLLIVVPGHLIFIYLIHFLQAGHTTISLLFAIFYLSAALLQVGALLQISVGMVAAMWRRGVDPDNSAIPYLTALGDLFGTGLLAVAFYSLFLIGDRDADIGE